MSAIEMPSSCGAWRCQFEPLRREVANPRLSGDVDAFEVASPRWAMQFSMDHPTNAQLQEWRAWLWSLRGGQLTFLAWDYKNPVPRAYMGATGLPTTVDTTLVTVDTTTITADNAIAYPWGAPQVTAIDDANRTISLGGFLSGAVLTAGDPISWYDGRNWVRVVSTETKTADASGVISDVTVEPALNAHPGVVGYALPLEARMKYACTEMRVDTSSVSIPSDWTQGGSISFNAYQIIRRS